MDATSGQKPRSKSEADVAASAKSQKDLKTSLYTLINRINFLHFQSESLTVILTHRKNGRVLRLAAVPESCDSEDFVCTWCDPAPDSVINGDFEVRTLEIPKGHHVLQAEVEEVKISADGLSCQLPEACYQLTSRASRRHNCSGIEASVIQNGAIFSGVLRDFNAAAFRLELQATPPQTFQWLKQDEPLTVIFRQSEKQLLSSPGKILRRHGKRDQQTVVIAPAKAQQCRFPPKKHRNSRRALSPAPEAVFTHPLTKQLIRLDVTDISGSGMAVAEASQEALLLPGMILENLELRLADSFSLRCLAQVIYCQPPPGEHSSTEIKCGLAILDMDVSDHTRLLALLHRADNSRKSVCPKIDVDQLWEFFFDSNFIYPDKYQSLKEYRAEFKQIYSKLYDSAPEIARHFIYQENGRIVGHMAMLRPFSNSWLIHHHAADRRHSRTAGLETLRLVGEAVNEAQALYSAHMDYVMCYFRPENSFPQKIFGSVAKHYDNPQHCSIDTFDYFHYRKKFDVHWQDEDPWELAPATREDLLDIEAFYRNDSGGLMLHALDLDPDHVEDSSLEKSYEKSGFQRQRTLFALKKEGRPIALFMLLRTEVGLNLSNLTNSISAIITDNKALPREAFFTAVSMLASKFPHDEVPVLTYPASYSKSKSIPVEKQYNFWVLDCQSLDPYFDYCSNYFKRLNRSGKDISP